MKLTILEEMVGDFYIYISFSLLYLYFCIGFIVCFMYTAVTSQVPSDLTLSEQNCSKVTLFFFFLVRVDYPDPSSTLPPLVFGPLWATTNIMKQPLFNNFFLITINALIKKTPILHVK